MTEGMWIALIVGIVQILNTALSVIAHRPHEKISREILIAVKNGVGNVKEQDHG